MKKEEFIPTKLPEKYMENTYKLFWSEEALNNLQQIIYYLENKWTKREIKKFAKLLDKQLNLISKNPYLFPKSDKSFSLRKSVLSKQTTIYYTINNSEIRIVTIFNNRQNPEKLVDK